jgi:two-component system LytT family response regulator
MTPAPLRVVVIDDEPLARSGVIELLGRDPDVTVVGEAGDGEAAVELIERLTPDFLLLDVQMPGLDGFEVLEAIGPERACPVVFITAWDQYAVRAFEVHALDYLLKPFDDARFAEALARATRAVRGGAAAWKGQLANLLATRTGPGGGYLTRIVVRKPTHVLLVPVDDVDWIEAADYCVRIHARGRAHVIRDSMQRMETRLDPARFFRAHRSAIVNLDRIREIQPGLVGESVLVLESGARIRLSRTRRAALERRLGQRI